MFIGPLDQRQTPDATQTYFIHLIMIACLDKWNSSGSRIYTDSGAPQLGVIKTNQSSAVTCKRTTRDILMYSRSVKDILCSFSVTYVVEWGAYRLRPRELSIWSSERLVRLQHVRDANSFPVSGAALMPSTHFRSPHFTLYPIPASVVWSFTLSRITFAPGIHQ